MNIEELLSIANDEQKKRILQAKEEFDSGIMAIPEKEYIPDTLDGGKLDKRYREVTKIYRDKINLIANEIKALTK